MDHLEVFLAEGLLALLVVLRDTRVVPLVFVDRSLVLFPTCFTGSVCLSNVDGFIGACAGVFVNAFFLFLRCVGFIFPTE